MAATKKSVWKTCSRGHKYRGSRCPYCWKRSQTRGTGAGAERKTRRSGAG